MLSVRGASCVIVPPSTRSQLTSDIIPLQTPLLQGQKVERQALVGGSRLDWKYCKVIWKLHAFEGLERDQSHLAGPGWGFTSMQQRP